MKSDYKFLQVKDQIIDYIIQHNDDFPDKDYLEENQNYDEEIVKWKVYNDRLCDVLTKIRNIENKYNK